MTIDLEGLKQDIAELKKTPEKEAQVKRVMRMTWSLDGENLIAYDDIPLDLRATYSREVYDCLIAWLKEP